MEGLKLLASVTSDIQHDRSNLKDGDIVRLFKCAYVDVMLVAGKVAESPTTWYTGFLPDTT